MRGLARFIGLRSRAGLTLVELVISMLILAVIAGIGAQSFMLVLHAEQEMDEGSSSIKSMQMVLDELRRDAGNFIPAEVGGCQPYSEGVDPTHGTPVYRLLTRLPERYSREEVPGQTQALLVEFALELNDADELRLVYSKQPVGITGKIGEPFKGVLAAHVAQFSITPERGDNNGGENGAESEGDDVQVPKCLNVKLSFKDSIPGVPSTASIPIYVKADKKDKQDSTPDAQPGNATVPPDPATNLEE